MTVIGDEVFVAVADGTGGGVVVAVGSGVADALVGCVVSDTLPLVAADG